MSVKKLTDWFPADVKPVNPGAYETKIEGYNPLYQNWNGKFWGYYCANTDRAVHHSNASKISENQNTEWRGLTEPADAAQ